MRAQAKAAFGVAPKLATKMVLGTAFIDEETDIV